MLPEINLLPEQERQSYFSYYVFLVLVLISILLTAYVVYSYFDTKQKLTEVNEVEDALSEEKEILQTKFNQIEKSENDSLEKAVERAEKEEYPTSIVMNHLLRSLPAATYLEEYEYELGVIEVLVNFETLKDISIYVDTLLASPLVLNVAVQEIKVTEETVDLVEGESGSQEEATNYNYIPKYDATIAMQMEGGYLSNISSEDAELLTDEITEPIEWKDGATE